MPSYAAFLRGVMPINVKMPELKRCFEEAGFSEVRTVLSSGNLVFSARKASLESLERRAEAAMEEHLGHAFPAIVRPLEALRGMLARDPYRRFRLEKGSKRVVTFLRRAPGTKIALPVESHRARILCIEGSEVFSAYVPGPRGPVFMSLIEKILGKDVTTRTWDTVRKVAA